MGITSRAIARVLGRGIMPNAGCSSVALLIEDGIVRLGGAEYAEWDAYLVGVQPADAQCRIEACRLRIRESYVDPRAWKFDMMSDAWTAYVAISRMNAAQAPSRAIVVEILDPFEVCDTGGVITSYHIHPVPRFPSGLPHMPIDLSRIK